MPTVSLYEDEIKEALGAHIDEHSFDDLCFQFGLELDEVTNEYEMFKKERGADMNAEDQARLSKLSKRTIYKVEVPANRYDLLCYEGLIQALRVFESKISTPVVQFSTALPREDTTMHVKVSTAPLRPFVVCAVLRDVTFTPANYQSFIELQEKLHQNLCRRRTLVAIGTHDLDTIQGPFSYACEDPKAIVFKPLNQEVTVDGFGMLALYKQHQQLKQFLPIIESSAVFPVIRDSQGAVLSLPPIINGDKSKITLNTKNVFIECTGVDYTKCLITLNTVVAMFSRYCAQPFVVEPVKVVYEAASDAKQETQKKDDFSMQGKTAVTPDLSERVISVEARILRNCIDASQPLSNEAVVQYLARMGTRPRYESSSDTFEVAVPITRSDILHTCDLVEDVCIAYGFNNIAAELPRTLGQPKEQPINQLSDLLRAEMAMAGFTEALTWALVSEKENFDWLRKKAAPVTSAPAADAGLLTSTHPVRLSNPKTRDFEVVRTSLLPGLLKTLAANKHTPPPMKLFELSDVVQLDAVDETGAKNQRKLGAVFCGLTSGFETVHGLLDQLMWALGFVHETETHTLTGSQAKVSKGVYLLRAAEDATYLGGRQAEILIRVKPQPGSKMEDAKELVLGNIGVLHPEVMLNYEIPFVVSAMEVNLQPFLQVLNGQL